LHGPVHVGVFPARLGTTQLNKLRKTHIDALVVKLSKQGLSGSTVRQVYTVLRAVLDDAVLDGLMARNPCTLVKRPGVERREARQTWTRRRLPPCSRPLKTLLARLVRRSVQRGRVS